MTGKERLEYLRAKGAAGRQAAIQQASQLSPGIKGSMESIQYAIDETQMPKFIAGMAVGLNQEGAMKSGARDLKVSLDDPMVKLGIQATQALKYGGELALSELIFFGLPILPAIRAGKLAKPLSAAMKAKKSTQDISKGLNFARMARDGAKGAISVGGANYATNLGAAKLAEATKQDTFKKNLEETNFETALSAVIGGAVGVGAGALAAKELESLGANQVKFDIDSAANEISESLTKAAAQGSEDAVTGIQSIYNARKEALAPIKSQLDELENFIQNSPGTINIDALPKNLKKFVSDLRSGNYVGLNETAEGRNILKIFGGPEAKEISTRQLPALKNNLESIMEKGFTLDAKADLASAAGAVKRMKLNDEVVKLLPTEYQTLNKEYETVANKFGNRFDPDYSNINSVYKKLDAKEAVSPEEAVEFFTKGKNSKASKKIGEFADEGLISTDQIENIFVADAGKKVGKTKFKTQLKGTQKGSDKLLEEGVTPKELATYHGDEYGNKSILGLMKMRGNVPESRMVKSSRGLDATKVSNQLIKNEEALMNSMGSNQAAKEKAVEGINRIEFFKQAGPKAANEVKSQAEIGQRVVSGIEGLRAGALDDPTSALNRLMITRAGANLAPQGIRQLLQSAVFTPGNKFGTPGK